MIWIRNQEKLKKIIKAIVTLAMICTAIYMALVYSKECADGIKNGIVLCITVLVPSLFLFMVIASVLSQSRVCDIIYRVFGGLFGKIFCLPYGCASAVILSMIGGYPIGAKACVSLYDSGIINKQQANKLCLIAVCGGPSFVINFVGVALLKDKGAGYILLLSQIISFFFTGIIIGRIVKCDSTVCVSKKSTDRDARLVDAVYSSCNAMFQMCGMVIVCCALISVCDAVLDAHDTLCDIICGLLEVTTACDRLSGRYPLYILSAIIGFAGVSVHAQVLSVARDLDIKYGLFFLFRIIQGIIAGLSTYILLILFPRTVEVFSTVESTSARISTSVWGAGALIMTAVCFVCYINKLEYNRR